jgi:hypothetical protein
VNDFSQKTRVPNKQKSTNHILGYPDDARLLISDPVNADDFGMCNSVSQSHHAVCA